MKHIVFVTTGMRGGGTERVISVLANYYVRSNHKVTILMIAEDIVEYELDKRVEVLPVAKTTGGSLIGRIKRIHAMRTFFRKNSECQIIAMGTVTSMFTVVAAFGLKRFVAVSERNDPNRFNLKPITKTTQVLRNALYGFADTVVLQTEDSRCCFPKRLQRKIVVIPNPLADGLPAPNVTGNREKTVMTAGRLVVQKNIPLLIDAFMEFRKTFPEYHLNIFGQGKMEDVICELIEERGQQGFIHMRGFTDSLYEELLKGGIYVSSSDSEGISNSLVEALSAGIPTIATDCPIGGSKMCIQNGVNGILISVGDKDKLVKELCHLAKEHAYAEKLSVEAIKVRENFSVERIGQKWLEIMG